MKLKTIVAAFLFLFGFTAIAQVEIKTSTINGQTHDISRLNGNITICATDLYNKNSDNNSFTLTPIGNTVILGFYGDLPNNGGPYYLIPGIIPINSVPTTSFTIPVYKKTMLIGASLQFTGTHTTTLTVHIHVNTIATSPVLTLTLLSGVSNTTNTTQSYTFNNTDTYICQLSYTGNPTTGNFIVNLSFY